MGKVFLQKVVLVILCMGLVFPGFSMMVGNTSGKSFEDPPPPEPGGTASKASGTTGAIEDLVIRSATYFLKGKAHVYLLSSRLEAADIEGVNFNEYQKLVNDALCDMRAARYYYQTLKNKANRTPYNQDVISRLTSFDYKSFSKEYGLNADAFAKLTGYLQTGDVRGAYARMYIYVDTIIDHLETIQREVYYWSFPKEANIWKLNQECASMLLFGQYMAQVFYKIP